MRWFQKINAYTTLKTLLKFNDMQIEDFKYTSECFCCNNIVRCTFSLEGVDEYPEFFICRHCIEMRSGMKCESVVHTLRAKYRYTELKYCMIRFKESNQTYALVICKDVFCDMFSHELYEVINLL